MQGSMKPKKVFKNFAEFWKLVRVLSEEQRTTLTNSLSSDEQKALKNSYCKGGWQDLFMRNICDHQLDNIKDKFGVDLLEIRTSVISGKPYLVNKEFWAYVNRYFETFPWEDIAYIFENIKEQPYDDTYVKLLYSKG